MVVKYVYTYEMKMKVPRSLQLIIELGVVWRVYPHWHQIPGGHLVIAHVKQHIAPLETSPANILAA